MSELINTVLNFIFPPKCMVCLEIIGGESSSICSNCRSSISLLDRSCCCFCGKESANVLVCKNCRPKHQLDRNFSFAEYDETAKKIIHNLKYANHPEVAAKMIDYIANKSVTFFSFVNEVDLIIPVPLFKKKELERGFNQAELLALEIVKKYKKNINIKNLHRNKATEMQSMLSADERRTNIKGAFTVRKAELVKAKNILLVDDIYTTGSTLEECASILLKNGAKSIISFTFAKAVLKGRID